MNRLSPSFASMAIACAIFGGAFPTSAQLIQQGPKLVGSGAIPSGSGHVAEGRGAALSADGDTAIVGGHVDNTGIGAAWIWTRSGGVWTQQGPKLVASDHGNPSDQGFAVALSADGNTAVVGGLTNNGLEGAAWVWVRSGGVWTQQGPRLAGADSVGSAHQGVSVGISADGNTIIVGGDLDNTGVGAAWIWTRSGGVWTQQGPKLVGSGAVFPSFQGFGVALSADGNTAAVGGWNDNSATGAVWIWTRSGGVWTQQGPKLVGSGVVGSAQQGLALALSADGNTLIVGGPVDNSSVGAAWIWVRSGGVWSQQGPKLVASNAIGQAQQGFSVALTQDGNSAIIGGPGDNNNLGAAWLWTRTGGVWTQQPGKLLGSDATASFDIFQGESVALSADGSTALTGGEGDNGGIGAAWVFANTALVPMARSHVLLMLVAFLALFGVIRLRS